MLCCLHEKLSWNEHNPIAIYQIQLSLLSNLSQGIVLCWEQSLQKSSESESSVMVVGKFEWTTYMPYGGGRNDTDASKLLHKDFSKNIWIIISFFSRLDRDFYNLIVRDEIEICTFYISCFETRSRICSIKSWISRRGREIKKDFSWSSENSRC